MREDIRLLGAVLGDTVREQNGEAVFAIWVVSIVAVALQIKYGA